MKVFRTALVALLVMSFSSATFAGDLQASVAKAVSEQEATTTKTGGHASAKATMVAGSALFVTGFAVGVYSFINNRNGKYSEFGEATARNVKLGPAGLGAAFAGGVLLFFGSRGKHLPSVSAGAGQLSVTKHVSW